MVKKSHLFMMLCSAACSPQISEQLPTRSWEIRNARAYGRKHQWRDMAGILAGLAEYDDACSYDMKLYEVSFRLCFGEASDASVAACDLAMRSAIPETCVESSGIGARGNHK